MFLFVGQAFPHGLVSAHAAAGIAEETVVLTSAAVTFFLRDNKSLHGPNLHKPGALYHKVMGAKLI